MYKVLIVDDEPLIREGLRTIVEWEENGFAVVGVAADGRDALAKAADLEPDLMVVDIRMPGMSGLDLMGAIREKFASAPRFLVLSGHADFEYARQAMAMQADGYILKPVEEDELISALVRIKRTLDEQRAGDVRPPVHDWGRERTAISLLTGEGDRPPKEAMEAFRFGEPPYEAVLIRLQSRGEIDSATYTLIRNRLSDSFEASDKGIVFSLDPYVGLVLAGGDAGLEAAYREIRRACAEAEVDFAAVAGGAVARPEELNRSFRSARDAMKNRFLMDGDRLYRASEAEALAPGAGQAAAPSSDDAASGEKLLLALDIGSGEAAAAWVRETGEAMRASGRSEQEIKAGFARSFTQALAKLEQSRPDVRERSRAFAAEVPKLYEEYRFSGLLSRLTQLAGEMADAFRSYDGDKQVRKMIELIRRNYAENLKLESLAELFGYNSSYLGKLFKNTTGEPFNTYLDKVRIERAKELLEQGMKVYQVAERVGYSNVDYFHVKFRKYVGDSPSSYRKK
ncbi:response regulator transcription factor [Cohnella zeiphila]|uniref:Response regulator transcription factor n=1 Tax=Cohnella zeiphila TaxID=2761120 RepID=A0A7X0VVC1_9BACL|nr:response regulator transcription factor [Cohnella zeiphila]MBB6731245.1 response regulator transcription factor [Cohnella zeiphila]